MNFVARSTFKSGFSKIMNLASHIGGIQKYLGNGEWILKSANLSKPYKVSISGFQGELIIYVKSSRVPGT